MMRGDLEINEVKLTNALDALAVKLATDEPRSNKRPAPRSASPGRSGCRETCGCSRT